MKPQKRYNGKIRLEIWLEKSAVKKFQEQAELQRRKLKPHLEMILEAEAEKL